MVRKEPVSVNWQTLFSIIPIIDLWATYRIEKFRLYLLVLIVIAVIVFVTQIAILGFDAAVEVQDDISDYFVILIQIGVGIILVRKWSKEWNEKVAKTDLPNEKFCSKCGTKLSGDSKFCSKCGNTQELSKKDDEP